MTRMTRLGAAATVVALQAVATEAAAQSSQGFAIDRFNPSERGSEWFVLDSLDIHGALRPALGVVGDYAYRSLVLYNADGTVRASLVRNQVLVHPGGALTIGDRLRLAFDLPIAVYQDGHAATLDGTSFQASSSGALGDLRFAADARLVGEAGGPITVALGAQLFLPTGDQENYLSDGTARFLPRLQAAGDIGPIAYAASLGFLYRPGDTPFAGYARGSEVVAGVSAGIRAMNGKFLIGPEFYGSTVVDHADAFGALRQTPVEALLGAHGTLGDWRIGAGVGPGLTRGFGEPVIRVLASVEWTPAIVKPGREPADRDQDGISDADDACPDVPGVATNDPKTNGCPPPPPPSDRDKDGIIDSEDACPDVAGVKTDDPKTNGCPPPPPDRDKDGIVDSEDACPDVAGVKTDDPKTNGCPPDPDRDKDGIKNESDACPDTPGPRNTDPKKNGCPAAFIQGDQIRILDQVKFGTGSAAIVRGKESEDVLQAVLRVLTDHAEIKRLRVEGHTDNQGSALLNKKLSGQRAGSVVAWLVGHGIESSRLTSQGFGFDNPVDTNDTPEGRKNNRRVEFHIADSKTP